ncbi:hypothetical protein R3P38DRAFT_3231306 [Favolaschia claudopus]|uniref:Uncharacterized protein n=1 Tax=Favolaschia claudopus TaxID=2862362 RepID=A0AAV9ZKZ6_9AGAR
MADDLHFRYTSLSPSDFFPPPPPPSPACIRSVHNDFALEDNEPHSFFSSDGRILRCNGPRDFGEIELEDGSPGLQGVLPAEKPRLIHSPLPVPSFEHTVPPALSDMLVEDVDGNCVHPNELQLSFDGKCFSSAHVAHDSAPERSPVGSELTTRSSTSSLFGSEDDTRERETLDEARRADLVHNPETRYTACILHRMRVGNADIVSIDPMLPDRFTSELRNRIISAFQFGGVPDYDTFKAILYAPIIVQAFFPVESSGVSSVLATDNLELGHVEEQEQVHSSNERDFMSDIVLDGDFEANTQVEGGGGTAVSVTSDSLDRPVVYYEDYGEDLLSRRKDTASPRASRKTKKSGPAKDGKITSFFGRVRQRRARVALVRRLRNPARSSPLSGPPGSSLASASSYDPRVHRPEVMPMVVPRVPRVPGSKSYSAGNRIARARRLRVEDLYVGYVRSAPVVAPRRASDQAKKLLTGQQLVQPSQAVPHLMAEVEDFSVELVSRKGYEAKVDGCFFATDVHLPILVPTPFNVGTDFAHATIYDLYVNAFVAYAGLAHAVDMSRGMRTVEGYRGLVLDNPYTIFFTPQNVDEPLNMSVATDKGRTVWRGNILVVKHEADTDKPLNITQDEAARITLIVRKQLDHGWLV